MDLCANHSASTVIALRKVPLRSLTEPPKMPTQKLAARSPSEAHNPSSLQCKGKGVNGGEGAVTRTEFGRSQFGSPSFGSRRCGGSPRLERFFSEDAERAAGGEMALDVEGV